MKQRILFNLKWILKKLSSAHQSGVALVITMLVMLTLVLISLSLVMQSNTEHLVSQNEQDSFHALSDAEGAVDYANREIRTYILTNRPPNLTPILSGQLNPATRSYLIGFKNNLDPSIDRSELDGDNEETTSGIVTTSQIPNMTNFPGADEWEVFRVGIDEDGDSQFDGNIRTVIYARLYDNYDPTVDTADTDQRMKLEVRAFYPVYVDEDGEEVDTLEKRGISERHLTARFGPTGNTAIRTDGNLDMHGSLTVCGECGSAHANGTMEYSGSPSACGSITGTGGFEYGGGTILGDSGTQPEVYIPIINPYNPDFVPDPTLFNRTGDTTLPAFLNTCTGPSIGDPGNAKYFALVKVDNNTAHVYKAYRNFGDTPPNTKWVWRLIADTDGAGNIFDTKLDNCGRVITCQTGVCVPDEISTDNGVTWNPINTNTAVDGANNTFYGFNPDNNFNTAACFGSQTETIQNIPYNGIEDGTGTPQNDWHANNFSQFNSDSRNVTSSNVHSTFCSTSECNFVLPSVTVTAPDTQGDWNTSTHIRNGDFTNSGNDLYSPLYGAVIFIRGNLPTIAGNISQLKYNNAGVQAQIDINDDALFDLNATWRATIIATGNISASGTVNLNPINNSTYRWALVAGRDLEIGGNTNGMNCSGTDCDALPSGTLPTFAGAFLAHEQIFFHGTPGIDGFVIAEDRAACSNAVSASESDVAGHPQIHYDCENPTDPWSTLSVRMQNWEETQRVQ